MLYWIDTNNDKKGTMTCYSATGYDGNGLGTKDSQYINECSTNDQTCNVNTTKTQHRVLELCL